MFNADQVLRSLVQLAEMNSRFVTVIAEDGFKFPTESFLIEVLPFAVTSRRRRATTAASIMSGDPTVVAELVLTIFKSIATFFLPAQHAAEAMLLQGNEVKNRLEKEASLPSLSYTSAVEKAYDKQLLNLSLIHI